MKKKLLEIVSKNKDMISADLWFDGDVENDRKIFPLKYVEFPNFYTKKWQNDKKINSQLYFGGAFLLQRKVVNVKAAVYGETKITDLAEMPKTTNGQIGSWEIPHDNDGEATKELSSDILEDFIEVISEMVKDKIYKEISEDMKKLRYKWLYL